MNQNTVNGLLNDALGTELPADNSTSSSKQVKRTENAKSIKQTKTATQVQKPKKSLIEQLALKQLKEQKLYEIKHKKPTIISLKKVQATTSNTQNQTANATTFATTKKAPTDAKAKKESISIDHPK